KYYILVDRGANNKTYYVAAGNIDATKRTLKHNALIYNQYGNRVKPVQVLKKGQTLDTYGDPVTMRGKKYLIIAPNRFVKLVNLVEQTTSNKFGTAIVNGNANNLLEKKVMHNAYLYNQEAKRANGLIIKAGSVVKTTGKQKINGKTYYELPDGLYLAAANIDGQNRTLKHNAYLYNQYGHRKGQTVLRKHHLVRTYGSSVTMKKSSYYVIADNTLIKKPNIK
ncbi:hypothetical protein EQ500_00410, partial [Lactobacillus sp. XV13L]|nr:hypothetical protein [Lactobacillus sp. XV13L]